MDPCIGVGNGGHGGHVPPPIWENILRAIIIYNSGIVRANISKYDKKMSGILIILGAKIM